MPFEFLLGFTLNLHMVQSSMNILTVTIIYFCCQNKSHLPDILLPQMNIDHMIDKKRKMY